jgi:hypothetical protein
MKWFYLAGWVGCWLFSVGYFVVMTIDSRSPSDDLALLGAVLGFLAPCSVLLAQPIASMVWLYEAWNSVPPNMRCTASGTWMTPGKAVGLCFVPLFNLYWIFVANLGLCDAIDRVLGAKGSSMRAPRGIAIAACVAFLMPVCNLLVSPILWAVYMFALDRARQEMLAHPAL